MGGFLKWPWIDKSACCIPTRLRISSDLAAYAMQRLRLLRAQGNSTVDSIQCVNTRERMHRGGMLPGRRSGGALIPTLGPAQVRQNVPVEIQKITSVWGTMGF